MHRVWIMHLEHSYLALKHKTVNSGLGFKMNTLKKTNLTHKKKPLRNWKLCKKAETPPKPHRIKARDLNSLTLQRLFMNIPAFQGGIQFKACCRFSGIWNSNILVTEINPVLLMSCCDISTLKGKKKSIEDAPLYWSLSFHYAPPGLTSLLLQMHHFSPPPSPFVR